jgi:hypothetical protein
VWHALVRNRFYRQPNAPAEFVELGDQMRACLVRARDAIGQKPSDSFIPDFAFALSPATAIRVSADQFTGLTAVDVDAMRTFDRSFREAMLAKLSDGGTIQSQAWHVDASGNDADQQPLALLQNALLDSYKLAIAGDFDPAGGDAANAAARDLSAAGLERHLDRAAALWTASEAAWKPDGSATAASSANAYIAEHHLESAIRALRDGVFIASATADEYLKWIALAGGWDLPPAGAPSAAIRPSWGRNWQSSALAAGNADMLETDSL